MIKTITVTNHLSESVVLDLRNPEPSGFFIRGIEGLGPAKGTINTSESLSLDGSAYNSARVSERNIVFNLGFLEKPTIEDTRLKTYKYFPLKRRVIISVETDTRIYQTFGYIESNEPNIFSKEEACLISVICPNSYFYDTDVIVENFSNIVNMFSFPFSNESLTENLIVFSNLLSETQKNIIYSGDSTPGITMYIHFIGPVVNLVIYNLITGESMSIDSDILIALTGEGLQAGDDVVISTSKGNKSVILYRDGGLINILNTLGEDPDWFSLERGDNIFYYAVDSGISNLQFRVEYQPLYEGI